MQAAYKFDTAAAISKGGREYQEDAIICDFMSGSDVSMAVLADGMGGHLGGEVASRMAVDAIAEVFQAGGDDPIELLVRAFETANERVFKKAQEDMELAGMGTTGVCLLLEPHGRGQRPVGVESEVVHRSAVPFLAQKLLTRLDAPQAPRSVEAGGGDVIPGGMKRHPTQSIGVAA